MMASDTLVVHRKEIDLDEVEDMDLEEYENLVRFVAQWNDSKDALSKLKEARGEEEESETDGYDDFTNDELREMLSEKSLPTSGNKEQLIERLRTA
jgi:hypothetical protein